MGNSFSLEKQSEDEEPVQGTAYSQVSSEPPDNLKNGPVIIQPGQSNPLANGDAVDARVSVVQDNVAVSSQKTMEISSVSEADGKNLGTEAKPAPPAAKSRFVFAFSRPVPGRTEEQARDSSVGSAQLDVSSEAPQANKAPSETVGLPGAAAPEEVSNKKLSEASVGETAFTAPAEAESDAAAPKPKELTFFDRLFRLDKDKNKGQEQSSEEVQAENPGLLITAEAAPGLQSTPDNIQQQKDGIDESQPNPPQQDLVEVSSLASVDLAQDEVKPEDEKAAGTDFNNSVMSFFKTLVSPSKSETKGDSEDKVKKDAQQTANTKIDEQPVTTTATVKSEIYIPAPQESPATKQSIKAPEPPVQQPAATTATATVVVSNESPKELTKERSYSTPTPLSKFFRKKTPTDDIEVINTERIEASPEVPAKDATGNQETAETKSKEEKPSKTNLKKFFKLSVRNDGRAAPSEEVNGQTPDHQTLDFTDRSLTENRNAAGDSSQRSSTETLDKQEGNPQEAKEEQQDPGEQETATTASLQNGGDAAKENTPKRLEKRQSFGGFFKGLSPKRMSDAQVQTDPVSIMPYVKPK
uniref:Breast carcinoma-amplified sequence 1 isoform X3 n=1 Tax=Pogona vitticeps TaxID=103695 RepID=A0ABM5G5K4_9SAUR